ncbi:hypothetical protein [Synechococcus phage BUCT-ZZ01]|nr:hypothetical protein [Synechococcus phage BUCT-ZZ01]
MRKRDKQRVFDKVATHLLTQRQKSTQNSKSYRCVYKNEDGLMCAAGCLIPNTVVMNDEINSMSWNTLISRVKNPNPTSYEYDILLSLNQKLPKYLLEDDAIYFVKTLQDIHDQQQIYDWKEHLQFIADEFGLDSGVLNQFEGE